MGWGAWISAHDPLNYNRGMNGGQNPFWLIQTLFAVCLGFFVYFLPTSIAAYRGSRHYWGILITNALGFLAGIPWLIALVWSVLPTDGPAAPSTTSELDRLASLRGQGLISEDEFTAAKKRLLS
ncbi:MAG TPA: superinfection immunity protein [Chthoniobacterales bacterium]|jgi:hypothetical protein